MKALKLSVKAFEVVTERYLAPIIFVNFLDVPLHHQKENTYSSTHSLHILLSITTFLISVKHSFNHLFHPFTKYLFKPYSVSGSMLITEDMTMNRRDSPCPVEFTD